MLANASSTEYPDFASVLNSPGERLLLHTYRSLHFTLVVGCDVMRRRLLEHKRLAMTSSPEWALPRLPTSEQRVSDGDAYGRVDLRHAVCRSDATSHMSSFTPSGTQTYQVSSVAWVLLVPPHRHPFRDLSMETAR
jgi:hypothetical protein